jgi:hypothetical protein
VDLRPAILEDDMTESGGDAIRASNPASIAMIRNGGASFSAIFLWQPTLIRQAANKVARRMTSMFMAVFSPSAVV